jgi:hypothetical protein
MPVDRRVLLIFLAPALAPPVFSVHTRIPFKPVRLRPFCRLPLCLPEEFGMVYPGS